jgi:hypothetical protein
MEGVSLACPAGQGKREGLKEHAKPGWRAMKEWRWVGFLQRFFALPRDILLSSLANESFGDLGSTEWDDLVSLLSTAGFLSLR